MPHDIGKPRSRASWRIRRAFLSVGLFPQCPDLLQLLRAYHELLVELDARLLFSVPTEDASCACSKIAEMRCAANL